MTAAVAVEQGAAPVVAATAQTAKPAEKKMGWNARFGAWVKAHPRLAVLLFVAL